MARLLIVVLLYGFLLQYFSLLRRDLQRAAAGGRAVLTVVDAPAPVAAAGLAVGRSVIVTNSATLGRTPENTVVVPDDMVSQAHLRVVCRNQAWWVEDLGSTNGTFVNDRPIAGITRLNDGDVIGCGPRVRFRVEAE